MKYLLVTLCFLYVYTGSSQPCVVPTSAVGKFEKIDIVEVGDYDEYEIFDALLMSSSNYVKNGSEIIKYGDKESGLLIWELETILLNRLGNREYFYFNIKIEIKKGKYRIITSYLDCAFVLSDGSTCNCANDIASERCKTNGCLVTAKRWQNLKCIALDELNFTLEEYKRIVAAHLANNDW